MVRTRSQAPPSPPSHTHTPRVNYKILVFVGAVAIIYFNEMRSCFALLKKNEISKHISSSNLHNKKVQFHDNPNILHPIIY